MTVNTSFLRIQLRRLAGLAPGFLPYISTLYYFEIFYLSSALLILYGKSAALTAGILLTLLYSVQIIRLAMRRNRARKLQLLIMDIHAAAGIVFVANYFLLPDTSGAVSLAAFIIRALIVAVELPLIAVLTSDDVVKNYS